MSAALKTAEAMAALASVDAIRSAADAADCLERLFLATTALRASAALYTVLIPEPEGNWSSVTLLASDHCGPEALFCRQRPVHAALHTDLARLRYVDHPTCAHPQRVHDATEMPSAIKLKQACNAKIAEMRVLSLALPRALANPMPQAVNHQEWDCASSPGVRRSRA